MFPFLGRRKERIKFDATLETLAKIDAFSELAGYEAGKRAELFRKALSEYRSFLIAYLSGGEVKITLREGDVNITKDMGV